MKKILIFFLFAVIIGGCKKDNRVTPNEKPNALPNALPNFGTDKKIKIKISFFGDYQNYQMLFGISSMFKEYDKFSKPIISVPKNAQWTQEIKQANGYNYVEDIASTDFLVESTEPISFVGFLINLIKIRNTDEENEKPLEALVKVYANEKEIESYTYITKPLGELTEIFSKNLNIREYN